MSDSEEADVVRPASGRKRALKEFADRWASRRNGYLARARAFHDEDYRFLRFLLPEGLDILDAGCGTGKLLAALKPRRGVGVDLSAAMIDVARTEFPQHDWIAGDIEAPSVVEAVGGPFDAIVLCDTIGFLDDCQTTLQNLRRVCNAETRLVVAYYNYLWQPLLYLAEWLGLRMPSRLDNWLKPADIENLLMLAGFESVHRDRRQLVPLRLFGLGTLINRFIATLPGIRQLCLRTYIVARPLQLRPAPPVSATVVIPCRNERGNIEPILRRLPQFCDDLEVIFVEGHSSDGTYDEIVHVAAQFPGRDVKYFRQDGKGKADAVFKGFAAARGEVLMILDADMTVAPEDLPKFFAVIADDKGEFVNGTRLVYPLEQDAMRLLNRIANHIFSLLFSWLLGQRFTDTLCGTKVLRRSHYLKIAANRRYFGDFDPFGDFDLIFGAARLNLKIVEVPVPYGARVYGETQISRFRHGLLLLRMVGFAYGKLKAIP